MAIVQEYDTRWYVIQDRYDYLGGVPRSMEDMKDRYCSVCRKLIRSRPWAGDENSKQLLLASFQFDKGARPFLYRFTRLIQLVAEREVLRKRYVASLENRTPEQIAEEEALYMEIKRLEQNERRFKRERDDLLRTIAGIESGLPDVVEDEVQLGGLSLDPKRSKKKGGAGDLLDSPSTPLIATPFVKRPVTAKNTAYDLQHCITRTDLPAQTTATKAAHQPAYLRSFKLPFPKAAIAPKVTQALAELGVSHARLVMPTQANVALLEGLLDATTALVETKKVVDKVEFDIQVLKNRLGMQGATKTEETEVGVDAMDVDDANDADGDADEGEGEDGRAQSVVSTRSARSRKHVRTLFVLSSMLLTWASESTLAVHLVCGHVCDRFDARRDEATATELIIASVI